MSEDKTFRDPFGNEIEAVEVGVSGIEQTPGICGGNARVKNTRIPVWVLVRYLQLGVSEVELLSMYPALVADDLRNARAYYSFHPQEIDHQIEENEG